MFLKRKSNKSVNRSSERGFSLIEVAIVLAVLGLLLVPLIQQYNINQMVEIHRTSVNNLSIVSRALQKYAINNSKYPVPSDKNITPSSNFYGQPSPNSPSVCNISSMTMCRTTSGSLGSAGVLIGTVPFAAIGVPEENTFDGYKRKLTYAVTENLTTAIVDNGGVITVRDNSGGNHRGTASNVHFVLVAHGKNGKGASTIGGALNAPCTNTGLGVDEQNCNNDAIFNSNFFVFVDPSGKETYDRLQVDVTGAGYYDDDVQFATTTTSDIWTLSSNSSTADLYKRTSSGNIKIGLWGDTGLLTDKLPPVLPAAPLPRQPEAKIDVAGQAGSPGDVRTTQLMVNRICDLTETAGATANVGCVTAGTGTTAPPPKVFSPQAIGKTIGETTDAKTLGNGINCGSNTALTGIKDVDEVCNYNYMPPTLITLDASCTGTASGTGGRKIIGGKMYCAAN